MAKSLEQQIRETGAILTKLGAKIEKKVIRKAMTAALNPYVKGLRDNSPADRKDLRKTMGKQVRTLPSRGVVQGVAGQSIAKRRRRGAVAIHIADQDTRPHDIPGATFIGDDGELIVTTARHPGTRGEEFVELTAQQKQAEVLRTFGTKLDQETMKEAAAVAKKF